MMRPLLAIMVLAATAVAQPSPQEQAKARFKQGRAYQDAGAFGKAADEYKAAYELDPRPEMLFNIAQAYRLAKERQLAVDYFKKYLDAQPSGTGADEARTHVATLTKEIEDERAKAPKPDQPTTVLAPAERPQQMVETGGSPTLRIAGLVTGGVGIVAIGAGVLWGLEASAAAETISNRTSGAWTPDDEATYLRGQAANRNMIISYVAGGLLVGTGAVLFWRGSRTTLVPAPSPTSASIAVMGRF
jgi:tetratricopeptide (TPR) repeat protein